MKSKLTVILIAICLILCGCSNSTVEDTADENPYILPNGLSPTEFTDKVNDFILHVYMPANQEMIDNAIDKFSELATPNEIIELKQTVGTFDKDKMATMSGLETGVVMPDNSSSHSYKVISTFTLSLKGVSQPMLIEFICDSNAKISTHSIWTSNIS